jgi:hypothetical protein
MLAADRAMPVISFPFVSQTVAIRCGQFPHESVCLSVCLCVFMTVLRELPYVTSSDQVLLSEGLGLPNIHSVTEEWPS